MPIPVLFLIQHLHYGGTEDHFCDLVTGLDQARFTPHVIHFNDPEGHAALKIAAHAGVTRTFMPVSRAYDLSGFKAVARVRRYLREHGIRVVVTFHFVADFIGTLAAAGLPARVISSRRDMGFSRSARQKQLGPWLNRGVARYIAVSDAVRQAIAQEERLPLNKIEVIYNGIDPAELDAQRIDREAERAQEGFAPGDIVIACVANMNKVKGHLTLVEAFARMVARNPGAPLRLLLAGHGPLLETVRALVAERGLQGQVTMLGFSKNVAREFNMADLVVLPSETEGFSNSIVQAMAYGRPVVACRVGGNPEAVVDGETGLLVPPRDPEAMATALEQLALNAELRAQMGRAGSARARTTFTIDRMMAAQQELIARVARGGDAGRG